MSNERADADGSELERAALALNRAGRWFREYEQIHRNKPDEALTQKAERNRQRAIFCEDAEVAFRAALSSRAPTQTQPEWRPIDSAPKDDMVKPTDRVVMIHAPQWTFPEIAWWVSTVGHTSGYWSNGDDALVPTHWMPLPRAPVAAPGEDA